MPAAAVSAIIPCSRPRGARLAVARHADRTVIYLQVGKHLNSLELHVTEARALGYALMQPLDIKTVPIPA